jgi:putative ABC transport system permease protein
VTAVGLAGIAAYAVTQRTTEIGIRMALGATPAQVRSLVMRDGLRSAVIGASVGLAATYGSTSLITTMLYEVEASDAASYALACLVLTAFSLAASYIPARRATAIDPMMALRWE